MSKRERLLTSERWILEPAGGIKSWQKNWGSIPAVEGMDEDLITEKFFGPMARQHAVVMGEKEHFCKFPSLLSFSVLWEKTILNPDF